MAIYAIGDLQGCNNSLQKLLANIGFDAGRDRLWFVGDLVNRGAESLQCLRFVRGLGDAAISVLGNHDLHLLCLAEGAARSRNGDTLQSVLDAPDREELLDWLRHRPMLHIEGEHVLVHAGLLPQWSAGKAKALAQEVERALRSNGHRGFLAAMYGNQPDCWNENLKGFDRLRVIVNAMTRMRICTPGGRMEFSHKGKPADSPAGYLPWFDVPARKSADSTVICGHWSALGLRVERNLLNIDTGCLWGGALTAVRLEDRKVFQISCAELAGQGEWD
jgi:bis(5'-nucleosyl)-tetraphosphatase (symmetrical)